MKKSETSDRTEAILQKLDKISCKDLREVKKPDNPNPPLDKDIFRKYIDTPRDSEIHRDFSVIASFKKDNFTIVSTNIRSYNIHFKPFMQQLLQPSFLSDIIVFTETWNEHVVDLPTYQCCKPIVQKRNKCDGIVVYVSDHITVRRFNDHKFRYATMIRLDLILDHFECTLIAIYRTGTKKSEKKSFIRELYEYLNKPNNVKNSCIVVGDINIPLYPDSKTGELANNAKKLLRVLAKHDFKNYVTQATRVAKKTKKSGENAVQVSIPDHMYARVINCLKNAIVETKISDHFTPVIIFEPSRCYDLYQSLPNLVRYEQFVYKKSYRIDDNLYHLACAYPKCPFEIRAKLSTDQLTIEKTYNEHIEAPNSCFIHDEYVYYESKKLKGKYSYKCNHNKCQAKIHLSFDKTSVIKVQNPNHYHPDWRQTATYNYQGYQYRYHHELKKDGPRCYHCKYKKCEVAIWLSANQPVVIDCNNKKHCHPPSQDQPNEATDIPNDQTTAQPPIDNDSRTVTPQHTPHTSPSKNDILKEIISKTNSTEAPLSYRHETLPKLANEIKKMYRNLSNDDISRLIKYQLINRAINRNLPAWKKLFIGKNHVKTIQELCDSMPIINTLSRGKNSVSWILLFSLSIVFFIFLFKLIR